MRDQLAPILQGKKTTPTAQENNLLAQADQIIRRRVLAGHLLYARPDVQQAAKTQLASWQQQLLVLSATQSTLGTVAAIWSGRSQSPEDLVNEHKIAKLFEQSFKPEAKPTPMPKKSQQHRPT